MKITDFSKIADRYDKNTFRQKIEPDNDLKEYVERVSPHKCYVLDLACGTGLYLCNQVQYFEKSNIEWHGLDASEEMLQQAKDKTENAILAHGFAEELPYDSSYFDYIANNYSFHHFTKKSQALDEAARVLKKNGIFKMHNISIHDMKKWWIYEFFPSAYFEDLKRFWPKDLIYHEMSVRNFDVKVRMEYSMTSTKIADCMGYVYNRDISVLTVIDDEEYHNGIEMMEYRVKKNPEATIVNDFAEIFFVAAKK